LDEKEVKPVTLSEVKSILKKISKDREELLYEQKIALEHAEKFAKLPVTKTKELIKELEKLDFLKQKHVYKIADILPQTKDDVKTILAKERISAGEKEINNILEIIQKHYIK